MDKRHEKRINTLQNLFAHDFGTAPEDLPFADDKSTPIIIKNIKKIDDLIKEYAPKYPIDRIAKVDLAVLRLSLYELLFEKKNPPKVIINEAVELAKEFGSENSSSFVNGVLGTVLKKQ